MNFCATPVIRDSPFNHCATGFDRVNPETVPLVLTVLKEPATARHWQSR